MALIQLIHIALRNHFVAEKLSQLFTQGFDEQLKKVLIELLISMKEGKDNS